MKSLYYRFPARCPGAPYEMARRLRDMLPHVAKPSAVSVRVVGRGVWVQVDPTLQPHRLGRVRALADYYHSRALLSC